MIKLLRYTKEPLFLMGEVAAICWDSKPSSDIGKECILSGHGRVTEFADVVVLVDGYSARVIRQLYTHIAGVSRVQGSTRYISYDDFDYYVPDYIGGSEIASEIYNGCMKDINYKYKALLAAGVSKEDAGNILPLGMFSKMVLKINVRAIYHLAEVRLCNRTYGEFRKLVGELLEVVGKIDHEWAWIVDRARAICEVRGYCEEKHSCNKYPSKSEVLKIE